MKQFCRGDIFAQSGCAPSVAREENNATPPATAIADLSRPARPASLTTASMKSWSSSLPLPGSAQ